MCQREKGQTREHAGHRRHPQKDSKASLGRWHVIWRGRNLPHKYLGNSQVRYGLHVKRLLVQEIATACGMQPRDPLPSLLNPVQVTHFIWETDLRNWGASSDLIRQTAFTTGSALLLRRAGHLVSRWQQLLWYLIIITALWLFFTSPPLQSTPLGKKLKMQDPKITLFMSHC